MPPKKEKPEEKPQRERFIETAREIGADETQEGFEREFSKIFSKFKPLGSKAQLKK